MITNLKKVIAVVIAFTMISGALLVMVPSIGESTTVDTSAYPDQIPMFADPEFRELKVSDMAKPSLDVSVGEEALVDNLPVNTTKPFVTSATFWDDSGAPFTDVENATWYDAFNIINMTKMGDGEHCELWVADDLSYYDPMDDRNLEVDILQWQVDYMIDEFDTNIYPTMNETFIAAPELNGSSPDLAAWKDVLDDDNLTVADLADWNFPTNDTGKVMIMVFNIIDENWYDGEVYDTYVAGYYSPMIKTLYDRNIMHIDCFQWSDRIGSNVTRPYTYESVFAHEYQHLLHDEIDSDEDTWVNEGLSMASEFLCGYGIDMVYVTYYLYWPDNSLTVWGDLAGSLILGDYGAVLMFMTYLYDHYGGKPMLQEIFFDDLNGIESIDDALLNMGHNRMTFDRVFRDWRIANLLLDDSIGGGLYYYKSFDRYDLYDPWGLEGPWIVGESALNGPLYHSDIGTNQYIQAYGVDYLYFDDLDYFDPNSIKLVFDGDDNVHSGWQYVNPEFLAEYSTYWWAGDGDQINNLLTMNLNLSAPKVNGKHLLDITTYWDIEEGWDFGFVQVSTDDGATWTSLDDVGDNCTDDAVNSAMESITDNLPGITGRSNGWRDLSFDLTAYDGQEILVGFRYMTDWGTTYDGWSIAEVSVDGNEVPLEELTTTIPPEADFMITIYAYDSDLGEMVIDVPVLDSAETAVKLMGTLMDYDWMIVMISPYDGPVDYMVDITNRGGQMPI